MSILPLFRRVWNLGKLWGVKQSPLPRVRDRPQMEAAIIRIVESEA